MILFIFNTKKMGGKHIIEKVVRELNEEKIIEILNLIDLVSAAQDKLDGALNDIGDGYYVSPLSGYLFEALKILLPSELYEDISYFCFEEGGKIIYYEGTEDEKVFDFKDKDKNVFIEYLKHTDQI